MERPIDTLDLGGLGLSSGEGRRVDTSVGVDPLALGGERYSAEPTAVEVRLDISRTSAGYVLRLRFEARLAGPCVRCLGAAASSIAVDAREVDQPVTDPDLRSPYLRGQELDLRAWARDALVLALPAQILCKQNCLGLCSLCGEDLNRAQAGHRHERAPDPRWAKLGELRF